MPPNGNGPYGSFDPTQQAYPPQLSPYSSQQPGAGKDTFSNSADSNIGSYWYAGQHSPGPPYAPYGPPAFTAPSQQNWSPFFGQQPTPYPSGYIPYHQSQPLYGRYAQLSTRGPGSRNRNYDRTWVWLAVGLVVLLVIGTMAGIILSRSAKHPQDAASMSKSGESITRILPEQLLQQALQKLLTTKTYAMQVEAADGSFTRYAVDATNIINTRLEGTVRLEAKGLDIKGYATPSSTFVAFTNADDPTSLPAPRNTWVQVRDKGKVLDTAGTGGSAYDRLFSLPLLLYDIVPVGNLSAADRSELLAYIQKEKVFEYDPLKAKQATLAGQAVMQYEITISHDKRIGLYRQLAKLSEFSQQQVEERVTLVRLSGAKSATKSSIAVISVTVNEPRIVKMQLGADGDTAMSVTYSDFDVAKVSDPPKPEYTWDELRR